MPSLVTVSKPRAHVALITLDNPARLNAMSFALVESLYAAIDEVARDNDAWVAVLTGAGRAFCAGLAPWQFYGPSTRRDGRIYLHLLARPYDTIAVRGLPIRRVRRAVELRTGTTLDFVGRCPIIDELFNQDPVGEVTIRVPEQVLDDLATVIALDGE